MAKIIKQIKFGKLKIGENEPAVIIAEIADSHNGSIKTAKKLVEEAKKAGADIAKFQLHLPDVEMVPDSIQMWDGPLYNILKRNLFTPKMHKEIMNYCEKLGIEYLCTPFCPAAVDVLNKLGVKAFKTGSGELTNLPMQRKLAKISAKTGKPIIISTGMSTWKEIAETVKIHKDEGSNFVLMNCTSEYPPKYEHINLGLIPKMRKEFGVLTGQSDHTMDNYTAYAAIAFFQNQVDLAALSGVLAGGTLAFLWFNIPPARFYMSETGILGLTTSLTVIAFLTQSVLVLPIIAFPLLATSLSVIIQLTSKKLRGGKKVFLVAPLHHHFEAVGWPAYKVVMRYWVISIIFAIIGMIIALAGRIY